MTLASIDLAGVMTSWHVSGAMERLESVLWLDVVQSVGVVITTHTLGVLAPFVSIATRRIIGCLAPSYTTPQDSGFLAHTGL